MIRQEIESSMIVSAGYEAGLMQVEFKNGAIYEYEVMYQHVYEEFLESDSKGSFLHRHIKSYPTTKIQEARKK